MESTKRRRAAGGGWLVRCKSNAVPNADKYSPYKLVKHAERLAAFERGETVFPVLVPVNLTNVCNHDCPLCTTKNKGQVFVAREVLERLIPELKRLGAKAMGFGGGGDPTCHPAFAEILELAHANGLESAVVTNGYHLTDRAARAIVTGSTYVRISLDADGPELYEKTHGMNGAAFDKTVRNIERLVEERRRSSGKTTIGVSYLLGPHTASGAYNATALCKRLGADYIRLRPFFQWGGKSLSEEQAAEIRRELDRCRTLSGASFEVSAPEYRVSAMATPSRRFFLECGIHHFMPIIDADSKVYPCCFHVDKEEYCFGDLTKNTFEEIWNSSRRREACGRIDLSKCPNPCMQERHNDLLWAVKTKALPPWMSFSELIEAVESPLAHSNFF